MGMKGKFLVLGRLILIVEINREGSSVKEGESRGGDYSCILHGTITVQVKICGITALLATLEMFFMCTV